MNDGEEKPEEERKKTRRGPCGWLQDQKICSLAREKRRLVEVPYTATLAHALNALVANGVVAAPVAAPPGRWIGAGGSMILESDPVTGVPRKHYIGMVTMLDVLAHVAEGDHEEVEGMDFGGKMEVPVSSVIGHSLEGLSLWTLNPNTSILDCMETFSKGVHRALVPVESQADRVVSAELMEASPGYNMLTQMDVLNFLRGHSNELKDIISCSVGELGAVNVNVFAVGKHTTVMDAIKSMREGSLSAVPVVEDSEAAEDIETLQDGRGKKLIDTFSATDLRGCPVAELHSLLSLSVVDFKERASARASLAGSKGNADSSPVQPKPITCHPETRLADVIEEAVVAHVHRVWVVDQQGLLVGLVSLTDMLRVIRESVLTSDHELRELVAHRSE